LIFLLAVFNSCAFCAFLRLYQDWILNIDKLAKSQKSSVFVIPAGIQESQPMRWVVDQFPPAFFRAVV
jgi:hypothetical protein